MAAHRYWRVYITAGVNWPQSIQEVEFFDASGAPLCTGGTAIGSGTSSSTTYAMAFDKDSSTRWRSADAAPPHWIGYDFGAGNPKEVKTYCIVNYGSERPTTVQLQHSDDGSSWSTTDGIASHSLTWRYSSDSYTREPNGRSLISPGANEYLYHRLHVYNVRGGFPVYNPRIAELELRETFGGSDITLPYKHLAGSQWTQFASGFPPERGFDDNLSNYWEGKGNFGGTGEARFTDLQIFVGKPRKIVQVAITDNIVEVNSPPTEFKLWGSNDNNAWTQIMHELGIAWNVASQETKVFPAGAPGGGASGQMLLAAL
jgi:hypothetical protein